MASTRAPILLKAASSFVCSSWFRFACTTVRMMPTVAITPIATWIDRLGDSDIPNTASIAWLSALKNAIIASDMNGMVIHLGNLSQVYYYPLRGGENVHAHSMAGTFSLDAAPINSPNPA